MAAMKFDLSAALTALLGRMKTNPSEFFGSTYRWDFLKREDIKEVLTEDELKLLAEGLVYVHRAEVNNRILQALLGESQHEYEIAQYGPNIATNMSQGFGQAAMKNESVHIKSQMGQAKLSVQQQYSNALRQSTPSEYLNNFSK